MPGPAPKPSSQRRRSNQPQSQGDATPVVVECDVADQPDLGFDAQPMVVDMWVAMGDSIEARFYSAADWQRARWELWFANKVVSGEEPATASKWAMIQEGLSALLVSPADKRKAGIELKRNVVDPDAAIAVAQIAKYRSRLESA